MADSRYDIDRLARRFETAVRNFGNSCIDLKANEKAFQAWYAASVIQEFGLARVYREIHLSKNDLQNRLPSEIVSKLTAVTEGNELFPDLSISWEPNIDARHSATRDEDEGKYRDAVAMLQQFAIVTEFKVTGSTKTSTPWKMIIRDLLKLGLFSYCYRQVGGNGECALRTYMVILDNHRDGAKGKSRLHPDRFMDNLKQVFNWPFPPETADVPTVIVVGQSADPKAREDHVTADTHIYLLDASDFRTHGEKVSLPMAVPGT